MDIKGLTNKDFEVSTLGKCTVQSPLKLSKVHGDGVFNYVRDGERILYNTSLENFNKFKNSDETPISFEKAGPKEFIFFEPAKTKVAIANGEVGRSETARRSQCAYPVAVDVASYFLD